jgi:hypothetical protein
MSTVFTSTNFARGYPAPGPQMATPQKVLAAAEALLNVVPADRIDADVPPELGSRLTKQRPVSTPSADQIAAPKAAFRAQAQIIDELSRGG